MSTEVPQSSSSTLQKSNTSLSEPVRVNYKNLILQHLDDDVLARLKLRPVRLPVKMPLEKSDRGIEHIFFIESGVGSMTSTFNDGTEVEVGLFGYESAIGISAFMGVRRSLNRIYMQMEGTGYVSKVADAEAEFRLGGEFQKLSLRYVQMQLTQATQSAACNAKHEVEQRLARWLLLCSDRSGTTDLELSQEFLAIMLGVQRTTVALAMGIFKSDGLVGYSRGRIQLLDVPALEARACECYYLLKHHLNNYIDFDSGFAV